MPPKRPTSLQRRRTETKWRGVGQETASLSFVQTGYQGTPLTDTSKEFKSPKQYASGPRFEVVPVRLTETQPGEDWLSYVQEICYLPVQNVDVRAPARVAAGLWLGDARHARDIDDLVSRQITAIVNVAGCEFDSVKPQYPSGWDYLQVDLGSEFETAYFQKVTLLGDHFQRIFIFMERCAQRGQTMFVHCMTGTNRSAMVCVAFLMLQFRWTLPKALSHIVTQRPCAIQAQEFQEELIALAMANGLLDTDEDVNKLLSEAEAPAAQIWQLAAGDAAMVHDRTKIIDAMTSLCGDDVDMADVHTDLEALQDGMGRIDWQTFKRWMMVGLSKIG